MCGRYTLTSPREALSQLFGLDGAGLAPRYNIAPSQEAPIVRREGVRPRLDLVRWGLVPAWAADPRRGFINARAETAAAKPAFRDSLRSQRCLVPADGFYEWRAEGRRKLPHYIRLRGHRPFALAGLWSRWQRGSAPIDTFTILTTAPNPLVAALHDRMPAILPPALHERWLDPGLTDPAALAELLSPFPEVDMETYEVAPEVNRPENDSPACIEPAPRLF